MSKRIIPVVLCLAMALLPLAGCRSQTPTTTPAPTRAVTSMPTEPMMEPSASPEAAASPEISPEVTGTMPGSVGVDGEYDKENMDAETNGNIKVAVDQIKNQARPGLIRTEKPEDLTGEKAADFIGNYVCIEGEIQAMEDASATDEAMKEIAAEKGKVLTLTVGDKTFRVLYIGADTLSQGEKVKAYGYFIGTLGTTADAPCVIVSDRV